MKFFSKGFFSFSKRLQWSPYQKASFSSKMVILDRGYPIKNIHFESDFEFKITIVNTKLTVLTTVNPCDFLTFFNRFLKFLKKILSQFHDFKISLMLHALGVFTSLAHYPKSHKKIIQLIISYFLITCRWKIDFFEPFFPFLKIKKTKIAHITDQK